MTRRLAVRRESFPTRGSFRISRGVKTQADVVVAEIQDGAAIGRGECVPYARYEESVDGVVVAIEKLTDAIADGLDHTQLQTLLPPGAARNALDCALWDLDAKQTGIPAWRKAGLTALPKPVPTLFTIGLDEPAAMEAAARVAQDRPLLKIKLGGDHILERVRAVRTGAPHARLVVDFNEGANFEELKIVGSELKSLGVELIEQPLPAGQDAALAGLNYPVPLGADESVHDSPDIAKLSALYQVINIKLDKTGGLTEALAMKTRAQDAGLQIMIGCMVATSLAMAPAMLLAQDAHFVDLDGPLLLARDREPGLRYDGGTIYPPSPDLWG
ncbi:MAG TPA: N-acetyl-D-Glu racemase DgcA [Magnetospirillaceae bacterium]|jgi:L-alanine-DL-glutamate epimerase-like enolase superfamily enzyme